MPLHPGEHHLALVVPSSGQAAPCPICGALYGFHDDGHGLRIPDDWDALAAAADAERVIVAWRDSEGREHTTSAQLDHHVQRGTESVSVPLPAWAQKVLP